MVAFFAPYVQQSPGHFEKLFSYPMLSLHGKTRAAKEAHQSILCNLNCDGTINHMDPFAYYMLQEKTNDVFTLSQAKKKSDWSNFSCLANYKKETCDHTEQKHWLLRARSTLK